MKKTIFFCLSFALCIPFLVSCSDDDEKCEFNYVSPKEDIDLKGATLKTVQNAVQGTWSLVKTPNGEYEMGEYMCLTIKGNTIWLGGGHMANSLPPKLYKIVWSEVTTEDGYTMHAFYPKYDDLEKMDYIPYIPYSIKDNVLIMGDLSSDNIWHYALMTNTD